MKSNTRPPRRSVLFSFRFLGTALIGSLVMALVSALAPLPAQISVLGAFISILGGLFLSFLEQDDERERHRDELIARLAIPLSLSEDRELYEQYLSISRTLEAISRHDNHILHSMAVLKLASVADQIRSIAQGKLTFEGTEGWRTVYDSLLASTEIREYQSIAWVRSKDYWQNPPGIQSMEANFNAVLRGLLIERTIILPPDLWPPKSHLPLNPILPWIQRQHDHGLWVTLVRETSLSKEPDLPVDLGIYGERAVGVQELDEQSRTIRFTLDFDAQAVKLAKDRWQRLALYATSFRSLLEQMPPAG